MRFPIHYYLHSVLARDTDTPKRYKEQVFGSQMRKGAYLTHLQYNAEPFGDLVRGVNMGKPTDNDYTLASTPGSVGDL